MKRPAAWLLRAGGLTETPGDIGNSFEELISGAVKDEHDEDIVTGLPDAECLFATGGGERDTAPLELATIEEVAPSEDVAVVVVADVLP